jgi:hypothetical protein
MSIGLAAQVAQARTTIAALTPDTTSQGAATFTLHDALFDIEHGHATGDRWFDVYAAEAPPKPTNEMAADSAQFLGSFEVRVRYDATGDLQAMRDRMAEDTEKITIACESGANRAANVQRVSLTGGSTETLPEGPHFAIRRLTFDVLYRRSI